MKKDWASLLAAVPFALALPSSATPLSKSPQVQFVQTASSIAFKDGVLTLKELHP
jgi:hypothetical protein